MSKDEFIKAAVSYLTDYYFLLTSGETRDFNNEFDYEKGMDIKEMLDEFLGEDIEKTSGVSESKLVKEAADDYISYGEGSMRTKIPTKRGMEISNDNKEWEREKVAKRSYEWYVSEIVETLESYGIEESTIDAILSDATVDGILREMHSEGRHPISAAMQIIDREKLEMTNEGWKDRVERNTREKLRKTPGLSLSPEEEDEYVSRYKEAHGTRRSSRRMAKDIADSVFVDRDPADDHAHSLGMELVKDLKKVGFDGTLTGLGSSKGMPAVEVEIENSPNDFLFDGDEVILDKLGVWYDEKGWVKHKVDQRLGKLGSEELRNNLEDILV